jgi:SPW repeat
VFPSALLTGLDLQEVVMTGIRFLSIHRNWEDWLAMLIGVLIGLSPWLAGQQDNQAVMWNAVIVGALVIALAALELSSLQRWEEIGEIACGLWLVVSPFIFGYAGALMYWHLILGAAVVLLASLELWQDWKLSEQELAQHGR